MSNDALNGVLSAHQDFIEQLQPYHHPGGSEQHVLRVLQKGCQTWTNTGFFIQS